MNKSPRNHEPTPDQRLNVLLEELQSQFRAFGEGLADVQKKVSKLPEIQEQLETVAQDVAVIKTVIPKIQERLGHVEQDVSSIKSAVSIMPTLATKKDLEKLEKRLTLLETH